MSAPMRLRVREMFDRALKPANVQDPDPGNAVPFSIRHQLALYRAMFLAYLTCLLVLLVTLPRTRLYDTSTNRVVASQLSFGLVVAMMVLLQHWSVCGSDPGYIPNDLAGRIGEEHLQHHHDDDGDDAAASDEDSDLEGLPPRLRSFERLASLPAPMYSSLSSRAIEEDEDTGVGGHDEQEEEDEEEDGEVKMDLAIPIRAKFCNTSKLVVATYDHHCGLLNTTIGERNRARFWLLLLWSTVELVWGLEVAHSGFRNVLFHPTLSWMDLNAHALFVSMVLVLHLAFVGALFGFHTFLMLANVTSYEFMRCDKIPYLANTRGKLSSSNATMRNRSH
ncbi:hypothetical protein BASA81_001494 [Batrachochytrium salamandrivorans]|nr:hypothetical protein BASA81_001494 [Batrachochytrium salamandrivorans]